MINEKANYKTIGWFWYGKDIPEKQPFNDSDNVGKFMTFTPGGISDELQEKIIKAIHEEVTPLIKHSDPNIDKSIFNPRANKGDVVVWYSTDNKEDLKRLAKFLIDNDLIQKTKTGKLYNISFKYDSQTVKGEYGEEFVPKITLSDLADLNTGELL